MRETRVRFLGREDPLEKEMAIHSSTLAWKITWTEEPNRLQSHKDGVAKSWTQLHFHFHFHAFLGGQCILWLKLKYYKILITL